MYGNGVGICIRAVIIRAALQIIHKDLQAALTVCYGAAAGAAMLTTAVWLIGTAAIRRTPTTPWGFASRGRFSQHFVLKL